VAWPAQRLLEHHWGGIALLLNPDEILETINMIQVENFDIRTITLGISLVDCVRATSKATASRIYDKITRLASPLVPTARNLELKYGIPIVNTRVSVTPISIIGEATEDAGYLELAQAMEKAAGEVGIDFIGGYTAHVQKGMTPGEEKLINSIPVVLSTTNKVCSCVNAASTKAGINMDAVALMGRIIKEAADRSADRMGLACAKLVVFANAPEDNPFMAGAFHGPGEGETAINIGISGPGVIKATLDKMPDADFGTLAEAIKRTAFKITRVGELIGREVSHTLNVDFGIVDLSLAPTPAIGDSVANILEAMGLGKCGTHGSTAALFLLNDAVKKGGAMASSYVGGLSGSFIPVSEDQGMADAVRAGSLSLDKLEAMTCVCSVGLDMIPIPGDTPDTTISAIIADEMALGVINNKTTAVRLIPVPGKREGEIAEFGGLLGKAPIMRVSAYSSRDFIFRGGRIPAPIRALTN